VQFIFSNGEICKIEKKQIEDVGFKDIKNVYIDNGDIQDYSTRTKFTAEEVFSNIKNLTQNNEEVK
jgi:mRNA degradation ribonuclease J1/J2